MPHTFVEDMLMILVGGPIAYAVAAYVLVKLGVFGKKPPS